MKKIKLLISLVLLSILFINVIPAKASSEEVYVGNATVATYYTLGNTPQRNLSSLPTKDLGLARRCRRPKVR